MAGSTGQAHGKAWEQIILARARSNGLLAEKIQLSAFFIGGGGVKVVKSDLDFRVLNRAGRVAFFDAKTYSQAFFDYSDLLAAKEPKDHQINRTLLYQGWGVSSGFLVWFRPVDRVSFFTGDRIAQAGPGSRFTPLDGLCLGTVQSFSLKSILEL